MDWPLAIDRNRDALKRIVAALFALAGLSADGTLSSLPRQVYFAMLLVLRPAESAVRRLIVMAAHGLVLRPQAPRAAPAGLSPHIGLLRMQAFVLIDPLKRFDTEAIWDAAPPPLIEAVPGFFELDEDCFRRLPPDRSLNAALLGRRLVALQRALADLPRQARRLARWQARRDVLLKARRPTRLTPFRPGLPPGWRQRSIHEVDDVLRECHGLALDLLNAPDTS